MRAVNGNSKMADVAWRSADLVRRPAIVCVGGRPFPVRPLRYKFNSVKFCVAKGLRHLGEWQSLRFIQLILEK